jgi:hypothetical protein
MHAARVKFANRSGTEGKRSIREPPIKVFSALRWDGIADCEMGCLGMCEMGCLGGVSPGGRAFRCRSACGSPCAAAVSPCEIFCNLF